MRRNYRANQVRIIGGAWRGRRIAVAPVPGLRPTADRARETLFNWLQPLLPGAACLDLFAGSGALGLEAASRGAAEVVLVESQAPVAAVLRDSIARLAAATVTLAECSALDYLGGVQRPFSVVFLDPPFGGPDLAPVLQRLTAGDWLAPRAMVYLEQPHGQAVVMPAGWVARRQARHGKVRFGLYQVSDDNAPDSQPG